MQVCYSVVPWNRTISELDSTLSCFLSIGEEGVLADENGMIGDLQFSKGFFKQLSEHVGQQSSW